MTGMESEITMGILRRRLEGCKPTIIEFLHERLHDAEYAIGSLDQIFDEPAVKNMKALIQGARATLEMHRQWPILVHEEPHFEKTEFARPTDAVVMTMSQRMMWLTQDEYVKRFGTEPPTAPIIKQMALAYKTHEDFDPEWVK